MKAIFKSSVLLLVVSLGLFSCKKEETRAILKPGDALQLTITPTTLVLDQSNAGSTGATFSWGKASFGYDAAINYVIQFCKAGTNFASTATTTEFNNEIAISKIFTVKDLNAKLLDIIPYGSAQQVDVRVKASVGSNVDPIYSNVVRMTVTAYRDIINYGFPQALWIAGNYQGWSPSTAPKIVDKFASGSTGSNYDGYINFTNASPEFKMVKGPDWSFGDFGGSTGVLTNGGSNLTLSGGAGVYRITANTAGMSWSATKINKWAVTGSATPLGWPSGPGGTPGQDHTMTFNAVDGTWTITMNLNAGELKFRANDDWAINFGDNDNDNKPDYGGNNIQIATAGNYTITLDLGLAGNYAYSIRRN
jgi:hypothetical protein